MPLYKTIEIDSNTKVLVWKITETLEELFRNKPLKDSSLTRVEGMKSEQHQRGFLSVRNLLEALGYDDFDLYYDEFGKPHLKDGKHISITHSYSFAAIIVGYDNVGIDMELRRDKISKIADKFMDTEFSFLDKTADDYIRKLTVIWGAKEAKYKMCNSKSLSFKDNMTVHPFLLADKKGLATVRKEDFKKDFQFYFEEIEDFTLVYALEQDKRK